MKPLAILLSVLLIPLLSSTAQAEEAIEALAGEWVVELFDGDPAEDMEMRITFVDDATVRTVIIIDGETVVDDEMRYEADADGSITTFPPAFPDGEEGTWELLDDGKLRLNFPESGVDGVEMVLGKA